MISVRSWCLGRWLEEHLYPDCFLSELDDVTEETAYFLTTYVSSVFKVALKYLQWQLSNHNLFSIQCFICTSYTHSGTGSALWVNQLDLHLKLVIFQKVIILWTFDCFWYSINKREMTRILTRLKDTSYNGKLSFTSFKFWRILLMLLSETTLNNGVQLPHLTCTVYTVCIYVYK